LIYKSKDGDIDLSKVTRLYPAAVIDANGEVAEMSLEWMDDNADKVKLIHYVLVFDSTPYGSEDRVRTVLTFEAKNELIESMTEVSQFFQD